MSICANIIRASRARHGEVFPQQDDGGGGFIGKINEISLSQRCRELPRAHERVLSSQFERIHAECSRLVSRET